MAQQDGVLIPNSKVDTPTSTKRSIKGVITFEDSIFNDGVAVNVEVTLTEAESKSSVDGDGRGRQMFRVSGALATDDPREIGKGMTYKFYSGTMGAYVKDTKFTKVEKKD
jgi:hypothetical protein